MVGPVQEMVHCRNWNLPGNASPGPLPRRDGVRCRQWGTRSRQHMFPVLASCTSGNELAHAGNGSFPAWGAYTSGNNPAHAGNGSFPANGDTLPETAQPMPAMVHFLYWGAHTSGNDPADVGVGPTTPIKSFLDHPAASARTRQHPRETQLHQSSRYLYFQGT